LAASFNSHRAGLPSPPGWLILFQHFESGTGLTIKELAFLNTAMGVAERSTCPHCGEYLMLALPPGGKGRRTLQCLECDRPDPLKSDALKWSPMKPVQASTDTPDWDAKAIEALEAARLMPPGPEKSEALKKARMLRNAADIRGLFFAKRGRPPK